MSCHLASEFAFQFFFQEANDVYLQGKTYINNDLTKDSFKYSEKYAILVLKYSWICIGSLHKSPMSVPSDQKKSVQERTHEHKFPHLFICGEICSIYKAKVQREMIGDYE